jgi:hypothetical protein
LRKSVSEEGLAGSMPNERFVRKGIKLICLLLCLSEGNGNQTRHFK